MHLRDLQYLGSFECSDERLNTIWQTGAYTVHLNMQDYLWDGIKRDRLVWIGDMHPETHGHQHRVRLQRGRAAEPRPDPRHHAAARLDERHQLLLDVVDADPARLVSLPRQPRLPQEHNAPICSDCSHD